MRSVIANHIYNTITNSTCHIPQANQRHGMAMSRWPGTCIAIRYTGYPVSLALLNNLASMKLDVNYVLWRPICARCACILNQFRKKMGHASWEGKKDIDAFSLSGRFTWFVYAILLSMLRSDNTFSAVNTTENRLYRLFCSNTMTQLIDQHDYVENYWSRKNPD